MKFQHLIFLVLVALGGVGRAQTTNSFDQITSIIKDCVSNQWSVTCTLDPKQFMPLRGLRDPMAQLTLTETTQTLTEELSPGRTNQFQPVVVLLVFPAIKNKDIQDAVKAEAGFSDCPPLIFGYTERYVFVTSPGYINHGQYP